MVNFTGIHLSQPGLKPWLKCCSLAVWSESLLGGKSLWLLTLGVEYGKGLGGTFLSPLLCDTLYRLPGLSFQLKKETGEDSKKGRRLPSCFFGDNLVK